MNSYSSFNDAEDEVLQEEEQEESIKNSNKQVIETMNSTPFSYDDVF